MRKEFTVTLIGKGGRFSTLINEELDFATHPYEVCLQEMVFTPGSWGNVRKQANWLIVYDKQAKTSDTLYLPPRQYHSLSDMLYGLNKTLAARYSYFCDMFYYFNRLDPKSEIVFPQPSEKSDESANLFWTQTKYAKRFRLRHQDEQAPIMEEPGMTNKPEIIQYGGGKNMVLLIQFCQELAIMLGIVTSLNMPVPAITPGWTVNVKDVNLLKNNLMMLWIFGDFVVTTMIETIRDRVLKLVPIVDDTKSILHSVFHMQDFVAVQVLKIWLGEFVMLSLFCPLNVLPIDEEIILVLYFRRIE